MVEKQFQFKMDIGLDMSEEAIEMASSTETTMKFCKGCKKCFNEVRVMDSIIVLVRVEVGEKYK